VTKRLHHRPRLDAMRSHYRRIWASEE